MFGNGATIYLEITILIHRSIQQGLNPLVTGFTVVAVGAVILHTEVRLSGAAVPMTCARQTSVFVWFMLHDQWIEYKVINKRDKSKWSPEPTKKNGAYSEKPYLANLMDELSKVNINSKTQLHL